MNDAAREAHDKIVAALRADYERQGYQVESGRAVPELGGLQPDLVARGPNDVVVAEVKLSGQPSVSGETLAKMAEAVNRLPGWRFVIATAPGGAGSALDVLGPDEVRRMIREAGRLPSDSVAAPLVAWAAFESALRSHLVNRGLHLPSTASVPQWIQTAAANGLVSPDEEQRLHRFVVVRNRLAHGLRPSDAADVPFVLEIADRLVDEAA